MLKDFFTLEVGQKFHSQEELIKHLSASKDLRNVEYLPSTLKPDNNKNYIKIRDTKFTNVSFSKTVFERVFFFNCNFIDCLFIGVEVRNCEFHNCSFKCVNTFKMKIKDTYVNPSIFIHCFDCKNRTEISNIAVSLFQQLLENSKRQNQKNFTRLSQYYFERWQDRLLWNKYKNKKPYKISCGTFIKKMPWRIIYRYTLGYGLRLRNLLITFLFIFVIFLFINYTFWDSYVIILKDVSKLEFYNDSICTILTSFFYTFDVTTKLIDSQLQPTSLNGMVLFVIQGVLGFIFLSGLMTVLINRFVK